MEKDDIKLIRTSLACPEQYDAFIGNKKIGYLRLRNGYFRVDVPDCYGSTVYEANPIGDGIFQVDERDFFLNEAKSAIINYYLTPKTI